MYTWVRACLCMHIGKAFGRWGAGGGGGGGVRVCVCVCE